MENTVIDWFPPARIYGCKLLITSKNNMIHCGVGVERTIVAGEYQDGHEDVVRSNGYVFSKSDRLMNNKQTKVTFALNDIVEMLVDTGQMTLKVSCRDHHVTMKLTVPRPNDVFRFLVYLWSEGNSVEMVDG